MNATDSFEVADIICIQHALHNSSIKSIRKFVLSLSHAELISLVDCYLQRFLPTQPNDSIPYRTKAQNSQPIDAIHAFNLKSANLSNNNDNDSGDNDSNENSITTNNRCSHSILKTMQSSFVAKYYRNRRPTQRCSMIGRLPPCLVVNIVSFLSFYDRNKSKLICFDFYQYCKDSNSMANQHSVINSKAIQKIKKNELSIKPFIHSSKLDINMDSLSYDHAELMSKIICSYPNRARDRSLKLMGYYCRYTYHNNFGSFCEYIYDYYNNSYNQSHSNFNYKIALENVTKLSVTVCYLMRLDEIEFVVGLFCHLNQFTLGASGTHFEINGQHRVTLRLCNLLLNNNANTNVNNLTYLNLDLTNIIRWGESEVEKNITDEYPLFLIGKCTNLQTLKLKLKLPKADRDLKKVCLLIFLKFPETSHPQTWDHGDLFNSF